jgi:hypothetical protein
MSRKYISGYLTVMNAKDDCSPNVVMLMQQLLFTITSFYDFPGRDPPQEPSVERSRLL